MYDTWYILIVSAYLLDLAVGDPKWLPHPVRLIGRYIAFLEDKIRQNVKTPRAEKISGIFLFIIVVGTAYGFVWFLLYFTFYLSPFTFYLLSIFLAYTSISVKSMHQETLSVISALNHHPPLFINRGKGGIDEARKRLKNIVGRDTQNLSEEDIYRAAIETISENTSDGIIAPMFYLAVGGPALALAYKAVNTLDSMVGYKNERYKNIGWFSARMDDGANLIPARLTALLMVSAGFILKLNWRNSAKIVFRDSRNHTSPNAGYPEAAAAGALNCQLGGDNYYFGKIVRKPVIGDRGEKPNQDMVYKTLKIMHITTILFIGISIILIQGVLR